MDSLQRRFSDCALLCYLQNSQKKKSCLSRKVSVLIRLISKLDKQLAIQSSTQDEMILFSPGQKGPVAIMLSQYCNIISIIVQSAGIQGKNQKKEWIFPDIQNQYALFGDIVEELKRSQDCGFDLDLLDKWHQKSSRITAKIILCSPYSYYNLPQSCFCISFKNAKQINDFQKIGGKGLFEVLFFNCAAAAERNAFKEKELLWEQLLGLLLFYLENHNLAYQINDIEKLMKKRLSFYTGEVRRLRSDSHYNYNILYYLFYVKPLYLVSPAKLKIIRASGFSKTVQGSGFSKKMLQMGAGLEKEMSDLQNSIP
ncbi:hypothetical protein [Flavobacterium sp. UW10123]|uniref:hypothetical protein n=1 Tax=Flavobacterium sp. UW10123 TaxID=3230800 RepID=UPI0025DE2E08|nr:hypothetical protein [uncultured Flavobacterium sp.]